VSNIRNINGDKNEQSDDDCEHYIEKKLKEIIECAEMDGDKINAIGKLMQLKGLSRKPKTDTSVQIIMPSAIEIPAYGSASEWEKVAADQQLELFNASRAKH